jgi:hypothetical protein
MDRQAHVGAGLDLLGMRLFRDVISPSLLGY